MTIRYAAFLAILTLGSVSGCAGMPDTTNSEPSADAVEAVDDLYDGEPEVVFATEFPVASVEEALRRAEAALSEGNTDLALYLYVRAYDLDSESIHALLRIAGIHRARGNTMLETRALTRALQVDPANPGALQSLGLIYLQAKRPDEARQLLERAVAREPSLWRAQNGLGVLADMRDDHLAAVEAYDRALAARPGDASLLNNRGYSYYLAGDYLSAARDFSAAAGQGMERAYLNLGLVQARQSQYAEAVQTMSRVVAAEVAYNDVGYIAMRQGDVALAETYFQKAIRLSPRYFDAAEKNLARLRQSAADAAAGPVALISEDGQPESPVAAAVITEDD